jgi:pimeloyl-ACP methyl ester carboxylesterase
VPRSRPFEDFAQLAALECPAIVVGSRDEADPGHPLAIARRYAKALSGAELIVEESGSPLAWQGGRVSRVIADLAASVGAR